MKEVSRLVQSISPHVCLLSKYKTHLVLCKTFYTGICEKNGRKTNVSVNFFHDITSIKKITFSFFAKVFFLNNYFIKTLF